MGVPIFRRIFSFLTFLLILPALMGCQPAPPAVQTPLPTNLPQPTPLPESMVTFRVQIPAPLPAGDSLYLTVLDEVTGLAFNPQKFIMQAEDPLHYIFILPFAVSSIVKYRYQRQGSAVFQEHISDGRPVRYRLVQVDGPALVQDLISRWTDTQFSGGSGRISGQVIDSQTNLPVPGMLVTAGGVQAFSSADGTYLLEGLPPGTHNLVAYSLDGMYRVFQQGAQVAAGSATPAPLRLNPAPLVRVTFRVSVPASTLAAVPLRLAGSLYQTGSTFADLSGGVNALASRMPVLSPGPDGRHTLTIELPAGADLRYKYTLGDGLWNAEHTFKGEFKLRQLIVPNQPIVIDDQIETWSRGRSAPITFDVTVPSYTPVEENVSIQFNPGHSWTEALPMWSAGNGRWIYVLYSPIDSLGAVRYRYCRSEQCSSADDRKTAGTRAVGMAVSSSLLPTTLDDRVDSWQWLENISAPTTLPNVQIHPRSADFITGVEFLPLYHPSWNPRLPVASADVRLMNAAWQVITPSWTYTRAYPPILETLPGSDPLWLDLQDEISKARSQSLKMAVFPTPNFPGGSGEWWTEASRDFPFWVAWYESYRSFLVHHAGLAAQAQAEALIIGGDWLAPALPGGLLADGSPANVPEDAEQRWLSILDEVTRVYSGELLWMLDAEADLEALSPLLSQVDRLYLSWTQPLRTHPAASEAELAAEAARLLDELAAPLQQQTGKTVVLGLSYPSASGWLSGCAVGPGGSCLSVSDLARPNLDLPDVGLDLDEQVRAYNAVLLAVNDRDWITGVVSRGYYPPAVLHDKSASIHGKPTRGVLWYWFPRLAGTASP